MHGDSHLRDFRNTEPEEGTTISEFLAASRVDLVTAVNLAVALFGYLFAVRRGRASGAHIPTWWIACFLSGIALLALVYLGPMAAWEHTFFWVHMTQHLVVTMAAAPLLVLGAPITVLFHALSGQGRRSLVRILRTRAARILTDPVVTWVLFATVLLGAHFTGFYDWALADHGAMLIIERPMFLIVAFLYYLPLIGSNLLPRRPPPAVRLASLALMMIPEAIVGAVVYFSPVILYDGFDTVRPFGLDVLVDQQMSGALMWGVVMVVDSFWMMWVAAEWWSSEERRGRREDAAIAAEQVSAERSAGTTG